VVEGRVVAEELWSRDIWAILEGDATCQQTLYCDVRPNWPVLGKPLDVQRLCAAIGLRRRRAATAPGVDVGRRDVYGSAWSRSWWAATSTRRPSGPWAYAGGRADRRCQPQARGDAPFADLATDWLLASLRTTPDSTERSGCSFELADADCVGGMNVDLGRLPHGWPFQFFGYVGPADLVQTVTEGVEAVRSFRYRLPKELIRLRGLGGGPGGSVSRFSAYSGR
jgi:hypothetical protein